MAGTTLAAHGGSPGHDDSVQMENALAIRWCGRWDSNPHGDFPQGILSFFWDDFSSHSADGKISDFCR
jgi:hypothetical protein